MMEHNTTHVYSNPSMNTSNNFSSNPSNDPSFHDVSLNGEHKRQHRHKRNSRVSEAKIYLQNTDRLAHPDDRDDDALFGPEAEAADDKPIALHRRPRVPRKNGDDYYPTRLITAFDPMKDRHMWTMWRAAVNGRIVDEMKAQADSPLSPLDTQGRDVLYPYSKTLSGAPPLSRFIRLDDRSKTVAQNLVKEGQGTLRPSQFIYFGLPRVVVNGGVKLDVHNYTNQIIPEPVLKDHPDEQPLY